MWTVNQIVLIQQANYVVMHTFLSSVAGQPIQVIGDITVGVVVKEDLSCLKAAFSGCKKQWSLLLRESQMTKHIQHYRFTINIFQFS